MKQYLIICKPEDRTVQKIEIDPYDRMADVRAHQKWCREQGWIAELITETDTKTT